MAILNTFVQVACPAEYTTSWDRTVLVRLQLIGARPPSSGAPAVAIRRGFSPRFYRETPTGESGTSTHRVRPSLLPLEAFPPRSTPLFASTALDALPSLPTPNAFYWLLVPEISPLDALDVQSGYGG
jgi:hypothetical protein